MNDVGIHSRTTPPRRAAHWTLCVAAWCALLGCAPTALWAQPGGRAAFEYDPYRVTVWVAVEPGSGWSETLGEELAAQLAREAEQVFGATWEVASAACPSPLRRRVAQELDQVTVSDIRASHAALLDDDKLMLVAVRAAPEGGLRVAARELDCRSRTFGEAVELTVAQPENLPGAALSVVVTAFAPVARIELVDGVKAVTRLRAGGLLPASGDNPAAVSPGDLLQPVIRRNDRQGEPRAGGIQRLPFTFLEVREREGHRVECVIHTGVRDAIAGRSGRTERLALLVRPHARGTRLVLRAAGEEGAGLIDYEVLTRSPREKSELVPLALTDRDGAVRVPLEDEPLRFIYIRHGQTMLARVPLVPGLAAQQVITLGNDDLRLLAESYFLAMQSEVMDLVARREVLAARIRLRLENNDIPAAQALLQELRAITTRADLLRLVEQQQANYASSDSRQQAKVDKMFVELRKLLAKHLDPRLIDQLMAEVRAAERA